MRSSYGGHPVLQVKNVAVGGRNTLNELYKIILDNLNNSPMTNHELRITKSPIYRDFRPGDIRHSNADISKAKSLLGYTPTHDIYGGMREAIEWYAENLSGSLVDS